MLKRTTGRFRFTRWDFDELRYLYSLGLSYASIGEIVGCSSDTARRVVLNNDLDAPLTFAETALLGCWANWRDLQRRRHLPGCSDFKAAYLAERCAKIAREIRLQEKHLHDVADQSFAERATEPDAFKEFSEMSLDAKRSYLASLDY